MCFVVLFVVPQASFAQTGGSKEEQYKVLPVPQGSIKQTKKSTYVGHIVKDNEDQMVGTLNSVVLDATSGNIVAGVVKIPLSNNRSALEPVPWNKMKIDPTSGEVHLKMTLKELVPGAVSPYLREIVKGIEEQTE
jgi:hypothetical protein